MTTALVLADQSTSLLRVGGLTLVQRAVLSAIRADYDRIVVAAGENFEDVRALLRGDERTHSIEVCRSLPPLYGAQVTVVPPDRLVTTGTLRQARTFALNGKPAVFNQSVGVYAPELVAPSADSSPEPLGGLWARLHQRDSEPVTVESEVNLPVTDTASVALAEQALCEKMRRDSAVSDGPLAHWLDRRVSLAISRRIVRHTRLRPNHITIIGTSLGLIASAFLGVGAYWSGVVGTLLFLATTIIDGCDGEVARLTYRESSFGQKFDVTTDNIVHVTIFLGLAAGLYRQDPNGPYKTLILILLGGFACTSVATYFFLVHRPDFASSGGPPKTRKGRVRQRILGGMEAMMNRDFAYILLGLALFGKLHWFFWGAAFGTYGFALLLVLVYLWRDAE